MEPQRIVADFYDRLGWRYNKNEKTFEDTVLFTDTRAVMQPYFARSHKRDLGLFQSGGACLVELGPGALPALSYGEAFQHHLCIDISIQGLEEARRVLQDRGIFVIADASALPLNADFCTHFIGSHCLYHMPDQKSVLREITRVLAPNGIALLHYSLGGHSWADRLARILARFKPMAAEPTGVEALYLPFAANSLDWFFENIPASCSVSIRCHMAFPKSVTQLLIPDQWLGSLMLHTLSIGEKFLRGKWAKACQYVSIIITKDNC